MSIQFHGGIQTFRIKKKSIHAKTKTQIFFFWFCSFLSFNCVYKLHNRIYEKHKINEINSSQFVSLNTSISFISIWLKVAVWWWWWMRSFTELISNFTLTIKSWHTRENVQCSYAFFFVCLFFFLFRFE